MLSSVDNTGYKIMLSVVESLTWVIVMLAADSIIV